MDAVAGGVPMKDRTITFRVPDFCPEQCREFDPHVERLEMRTLDGMAIERTESFSCEHEGYCRNLYGAMNEHTNA